MDLHKGKAKRHLALSCHMLPSQRTYSWKQERKSCEETPCGYLSGDRSCKSPFAGSSLATPPPHTMHLMLTPPWLHVVKIGSPRVTRACRDVSAKHPYCSHISLVTRLVIRSLGPMAIHKFSHAYPHHGHPRGRVSSSDIRFSRRLQGLLSLGECILPRTPDKALI